MSRPRTPGLARLLTAALFLGLLHTSWLSGCESGDAGRKIDDARVAHAQGRLEEAQRLYEEALQEEPGNAAALVGLANIYLDRENLDAAGGVFDRLEPLELDRRSEQLVGRARLRYDRLVYEQARGDGPTNPANPEQYESALIGLFNTEGDQQYAEELVALFTYQARTALGVADPSEAVLPTSAYVQDAPLEILRAALTAYQRFTERDPRLTRVLNPPDAVEQEAQTIVLALQLEIFDREFDNRFNTTLRGRLIQAERFNAERNMLRIAFTSPEPFEGARPEGEALETFQRELALTLVIEELTDLAYEARGMQRGDNRPLQLGRTREDVEQVYTGLEVVSFEFARDGTVTMEVLAPYHLLPRTAYRLEQYLDWRARNQPEGTGVGTARGTGNGTGQAVSPEGTGEDAVPATGESEGTGSD